MGAQVVVDVANSPSFEAEPALDFFEASGRHLLAAEAAAGVGHHLALSVVGTERLLESGYFRAKLAQERLIKASGIPYTILRSTQFFEFVNSIITAGTEGDVIRLSPALLQPVASDDVADALADLTLGPPLNATAEVAGPEACPLDKFAREFLAATGDRREVIADIHARYFGIALNDRSLTPLANIRAWARFASKTGSVAHRPGDEIRRRAPKAKLSLFQRKRRNQDGEHDHHEGRCRHLL